MNAPFSTPKAPAGCSPDGRRPLRFSIRTIQPTPRHTVEHPNPLTPPATAASAGPSPSARATSSSAWAHRLGYAGLLPFIVGAALVWLVNDADAHVFATTTLAAYGALIVSFLGGILWGLAFREASPAAGATQTAGLDPRLLGWGVGGSLLAWVAVAMPPHAGLVVLGALLMGSYLIDRRLYPAHGASQWLTLRFRLSTIASLCCFLGAAGS